VTNCSSGDSISTGWWVLFAAENKTNICVPQQQQLSINFIVASAAQREWLFDFVADVWVEQQKEHGAIVSGVVGV
jgi:hypothetical protein